MTHVSRNKRARSRSKLLLVTLLVVGSISAAEAAGFQLIVHPSNPVTELSRTEVSRLFFKKVRRWESGVKVKPVDLSARTELRAEFSEEVHGRSYSSVRAYWQQQIFTGRDVPPPEQSSDSEVIEYVLANPGAIGYVAAGVDTGGAGTVEVTE